MAAIGCLCARMAFWNRTFELPRHPDRFKGVVLGHSRFARPVIPMKLTAVIDTWGQVCRLCLF